MSLETAVPLSFEGRQLENVLVSRRDRQPRPGVVIFPSVAGVSDLEIGFARQLVELGYSGFVADVFGASLRGAAREVKMAEMNRLRGDRANLRRLLTALYDCARGLDAIDGERILATGFCFGGQCALDLARSGAGIAGAVSFHGLLDPPGLPPEEMRAKILAFHGWDDPLAKPESVLAFAEEMTKAGVDWQVHAFGHVGHSFTNPAADGTTPGLKYDALATERSWTAFINFLEEVFG